MVEAGEETSFHARGVKIAQVVVAVMGTGLAAAIVVSATPGYWKLGVTLLSVPLVVLATVRGFRTEIDVRESGITIKNYWRTYTFRWEEIREVRIGWATIAGGDPEDAVQFLTTRRSSPVVAQATATLREADRMRFLDSVERVVASRGLPIRVSR